MSVKDPTPDSREKALLEGVDAGLYPVFGDPYTLLLDIDSKGALKGAKFMIKQFRHRLRVNRVDMTRSKSGNWHLYVRMGDSMSREERLFWQAALGSDQTRAGLDWIWAQDGHPEECFLLEILDTKMETIEL